MNRLTLYNLLWRCVTPLVKRYLRRRAKRAPAYLEHWNERFSGEVQGIPPGAIWIHAVSVGETRAAEPLVRALREAWPDAPLLFTQMTPTGRATALALYGGEACVRYLPYDIASSVRDFLEQVRPCFGVLMETELWPNLIHEARRQGIPLFLVNARLSEKSFRGYRRVRGLIGPALGELAAIATQSEEDAGRFQALGECRIRVCGSIKYDIAPPAAQLALGETFKARIGARPVFVCASTREGEEAQILAAWRTVQTDCLLVLVPRHPERFDAVARLAAEQGLKVARRSEDGIIDPSVRVWIGDSMGEVYAYYAACDVAFVGGSLEPLGAHNLIEPAAVGKPVLFGPSTFNFAEASRLALEAGAARQVADAGELVSVVRDLLRDAPARQAMSEAAREFSLAHRGATDRVLGLMRETLGETCGAC
ncbi:lipid IV(A) 3-deoxy-D-manno-octulosonic acid transferase [Paludibacterium paludis]|uniref:3-deoxy-D-manno-octulosonic acid transferase n=1 Tax=Paludibacterium paludis TaxID=1225769 RepID=A0A918U966_9NEIS|nr:lipid IV(A) 3-deoxy-D-manno-octulosonic acid transferase [Paludibacterium paludis]GGY12430.1 3-deoxy-D-manno-octulosonic acid transferase [Paludibacterium paludis]